ncbi:MAG: hypothetical protein IPP81_13880 [Chitinophagaceae bacterium]|nr:hypothetical protein [Chitinophagaceae bacterium]
MKKIICLTGIILTTILLTFNSCVKDPPVDDTGGSGTGGGGTGGGGTGGGGTGGGGGTTPPTVTTPSTLFLASQNVNAASYGYVTTEQFTITTTTSFYFRISAQFYMQAAIITPAQLANFTSMGAFTGYAILITIWHEGSNTCSRYLLCCYQEYFNQCK